MTYPSLKHQLLVAMPNVDDPYFQHSVALICEHNADGAMGILINRPIELSLFSLFRQLDIPSDAPSMNSRFVLAGGPVQQERGFVIHPPMGEWDSSLRLNEQISITTSKDVLQAMARGELPESTFVALGYAGWSQGQLEDEITRNFWLTVPLDTTIIFNTPFTERWQKAIASLGIDVSQLCNDVGHA